MKKVQAPVKQLYDDLRTQILERQIMPGTLLPSENMLCEKYSISRPTVRRALDRLIQQNLIEKQPGVGTFVKVFHVGGAGDQIREFRFGVDVGPVNDAAYYWGHIWAGINKSLEFSHCFFSTLSPQNLSRGHFAAHVDGLLLLLPLPEAEYRQIAELKKPSILINAISSHPDLAYVLVDNYQEAKQAVKYLIQGGHRKIALVGGDIANMGKRSQGWEDAFRDAGLEVPEHLRLQADGVHLPYPSTEKFICSQDFSAVFFTNGHWMRLFANEFSRLRGVRLDALEVLCFDDVDAMPEFDEYKCNFIRMPLEKMGKMAVDYLIRKISDPDYPVLRQYMSCSMVIRHRYN